MKCYRGKGFAIAENTLPNAFYTCGNINRCKGVTIAESRALYACQAVMECYRSKAGAIPESLLTNTCHTPWNMNRCKAGTLHECRFPDSCYLVCLAVISNRSRDGNRCQVGIVFTATRRGVHLVCYFHSTFAQNVVVQVAGLEVVRP